jgi:uncharacterized protein YukE
MNDGFRADHERLTDHAADFGHLAERAGGIARDLATKLDGLGASWGVDEVGRSFAVTHDGPVRDTLTGMNGLAGKLGEVGTRLTDMARQYREADASAADGVGKAGA